MDKTALRLVLWAGTVAAASVYPARPARGQTEAPAESSELPEGAATLNGLAPGHTGQVAGSPLDGSGTAIVPFDLDAMKVSPESPIAGPAAAALAPRPPGTIDEQVLAEEIAAQLEPMEDCRTSVARRKQVVASDVAADRLTLRWIIAETGQAFGAEVVATTPTDDGVLDCVKRQMAGWTFSRPSGGPLPIERDFTFHSSLPAK